jgi:surface antigen
MALQVLDPPASSITSPDTVYGPGAGHLHESIGDNPYPYGECTWYVWQYYHDTQQVNINGQLGNATDWVNSAHREMWAVDDQPLQAKTVCWSAARYPEFGHVAVVDQVNGDGSFDVLEMNFTYFADEHPELAGKIDRRTVRGRDGIQGFISPTGVRTTSGAPAGDLLSTLGGPLGSIGDAIRQAGLYLEAEMMTAQLKASAMGQVALGTLLSGGGLALGAFSAYGGGQPAVGARRLGRRFRRVRRSIAPRPESPIGRRSFGETEQRWLSPRERRALAEARRRAAP